MSRRSKPRIVASLPVTCCGEEHAISLVDTGRLVLHDHPGSPLDSEIALAALDLDPEKHVPECFQKLLAWQKHELEFSRREENLPFRAAADHAARVHYARESQHQRARTDRTLETSLVARIERRTWDIIDNLLRGPPPPPKGGWSPAENQPLQVMTTWEEATHGAGSDNQAQVNLEVVRRRLNLRDIVDALAEGLGLEVRPIETKAPEDGPLPKPRARAYDHFTSGTSSLSVEISREYSHGVKYDRSKDGDRATLFIPLSWLTRVQQQGLQLVENCLTLNAWPVRFPPRGLQLATFDCLFRVDIAKCPDWSETISEDKIRLESRVVGLTGDKLVSAKTFSALRAKRYATFRSS